MTKPKIVFITLCTCLLVVALATCSPAAEHKAYDLDKAADMLRKVGEYCDRKRYAKASRQLAAAKRYMCSDHDCSDVEPLSLRRGIRHYEAVLLDADVRKGRAAPYATFTGMISEMRYGASYVYVVVESKDRKGGKKEMSFEINEETMPYRGTLRQGRRVTVSYHPALCCSDDGLYYASRVRIRR